MAFIDILTAQLFVLGFIGLTLAYTTMELYLSYSKGKLKPRSRGLHSAAIPILLLGLYVFATGIYGQFTWPLPGSYNILFYDVYTLFGLLMIGFAWSIRSGSSLRFIGFLSMLFGLMVIYYGISGYSANLTEVPFYLLLLYLGFGGSGILAFPVTIAIDREEEGTKNKSALWRAAIYLFIVVLILGSVLALIIASSAVPAHLLSPP